MPASTRALSQAATGVVREHRRVVAAEEDQMLGVLGGNDHQPLTQYLRGEARHRDRAGRPQGLRMSGAVEPFECDRLQRILLGSGHNLAQRCARSSAQVLGVSLSSGSSLRARPRRAWRTRRRSFRLSHRGCPRVRATFFGASCSSFRLAPLAETRGPCPSSSRSRRREAQLRWFTTSRPKAIWS